MKQQLTTTQWLIITLNTILTMATLLLTDKILPPEYKPITITTTILIYLTTTYYLIDYKSSNKTNEMKP